MVILVDTREQLPMFVAPQAARCTLHAGDYTTAKLLHKFHIERKSPVDLYGTLTRGHRRFKNELWRAKDSKTTLVMLIECTRKDFINLRFTGGHRLKYPMDSIDKMITTIEGRYQLEFIWCNGRAHAVACLLTRLRAEELKRNKHKARYSR